MTCVDGGAPHRTYFSVTCTSDSEILAAHHSRQLKLSLLIVPKDIILTPISFLCSREAGPGKDFVAS